MALDDTAAFFQLKELLGIAAGGIPNNGTLPTEPGLLGGFRLAQAALYELRQGRKNLREDGILYKGRPAFMTDDLLQAMQREMEEQQQTAIRDRWQQFLARSGPVVQSVADHPALRAMIDDLVGPVQQHAEITCLFYDAVGAEIRPHVDVDQFSVNANVLVSHTAASRRESEFVLYPVEGEPRRLHFEPGELILFYADCIVHARTPIAEGEKVRAVSIGFRPHNELHYDEV